MAPSRNRSMVMLGWISCFLLVISMVTAQSYYNPYPYTNYHLPSSFNTGIWWMQTQCHWGVTGYRSNSLFQCGSFSCPTLWYGSTKYACPPGMLYSNSLQTCIPPIKLASARCVSRY